MQRCLGKYGQGLFDVRQRRRRQVRHHLAAGHRDRKQRKQRVTMKTIFDLQTGYAWCIVMPIGHVLRWRLIIWKVLPMVLLIIMLFRRIRQRYFTLEDRKKLFNKIADVLEPDGYLIIGSTESLTGICPRFIPKRHLRSIFYQLK